MKKPLRSSDARSRAMRKLKRKKERKRRISTSGVGAGHGGTRTWNSVFPTSKETREKEETANMARKCVLRIKRRGERRR